MKLTVEIPDEIVGRKWIRVVVGNELVARKHPDYPLEVKLSRCKRCGQCCMDIEDDGPCSQLIKTKEGYDCRLGVNKPFSCIAGSGSGKVDGCTEEFMYVE